MSLLYIHNATYISPQQTFGKPDLRQFNIPVNSKLEVLEPAYDGIPAGALRRMGKAIRIGVGAALPLVKGRSLDGIIIGTSNGGMEDCIKFLNQINDYNEGMLTPGNFVGSTPNAIAAQIGFITGNKQYNITHQQSGLSFENALIDAAMLVNENAGSTYLVGGVDEISDYNYNIDWLGGWYKKEEFNGQDFYEAKTPGSIAGEGAAMFAVSGSKENALAVVDAVHIFHSNDAAVIAQQLQTFISEHLPAGESIDLFLTGENGDSRYTHYCNACETVVRGATVARYKHITGEYPTSSAAALWLTCRVLQQQELPAHMVKKTGSSSGYKRVLIYNHYKAVQQSFMLVSMVDSSAIV